MAGVALHTVGLGGNWMQACSVLAAKVGAPRKVRSFVRSVVLESSLSSPHPHIDGTIVHSVLCTIVPFMYLEWVVWVS